MKKIAFFFLFTLLLWSCKVNHLADINHKNVGITHDSDISADQEITDLISPYKVQLDAKMNEVIGQTTKELTKAQPESTLGNWTADAIQAQAELNAKEPVDFAFVNYGGIRIPAIAKGNVTVGKIFELMPFDNMLVILEVKGDILLEFFNSVTARGGWPMSAEVQCTFNEQGEISQLTLSGKSIDNNRTYHVAMSDYIANGGDQCSFFKPLKRENTGLLFRDAFLNHVRYQTGQGEKIDSDIKGRMVIK